MLSISSSWNYKTNKNMRNMLSQVKEVGLDAIELGYEIKHEHLDEIIHLLDEMNIKVTNVHNFCPMPYDGPSNRHASGYYYLSSLDEDERKKAVKWTKVSVDTASRVRAKAVVVHAGTIDTENDLVSSFMKMHRKGKKGTRELNDLRSKMLESREKNKKPFIDALTKSLKEVMPYAKRANIAIGLETRYYPHEIPSFEEIGYFLDLFSSQGMFYWHDVGHAQVNEMLGIRPHLDFINQYKKYLIGAHIHGLKDLEDHFAPFCGDFDLKGILPFFDDSVLRIIEAHPKATIEQIKKAVERLSS